MDYEKTLAGLCALPGPSGFEGQAARAALELLRPLVDEAFPVSYTHLTLPTT